MAALNNEISAYLVFKLGEEEFAAHAAKVLHILEMVKITEVPQAPTFMKGVINLRGSVLPVIDTRLRFGMSSIEVTPSTCIVVVESVQDGHRVELGAMVDSVQAVIDVDKGQILAPPKMTQTYQSRFIDGMLQQDDKFVMVINTDKLFTISELAQISTLVDETV